MNFQRSALYESTTRWPWIVSFNQDQDIFFQQKMRRENDFYICCVFFSSTAKRLVTSLSCFFILWILKQANMTFSQVRVVSWLEGGTTYTSAFLWMKWPRNSPCPRRPSILYDLSGHWEPRRIFPARKTPTPKLCLNLLVNCYTHDGKTLSIRKDFYETD